MVWGTRDDFQKEVTAYLESGRRGLTHLKMERRAKGRTKHST